jgi:hypothetical protein
MISGLILALILAYILVGEVIACVVAIDGSIYDHRNGLMYPEARWYAAMSWVMLVIFWPSVVTSIVKV